MVQVRQAAWTSPAIGASGATAWLSTSARRAHSMSAAVLSPAEAEEAGGSGSARYGQRDGAHGGCQEGRWQRRAGSPGAKGKRRCQEGEGTGGARARSEAKASPAEHVDRDLAVLATVSPGRPGTEAVTVLESARA
ncbi:MAG: hypothetical protein ABIK89_23335 [Planctomycetota bacterium]